MGVDKEAMKQAVAETVSLCVERYEVADSELEMAVWNTPCNGATLRTTLVCHEGTTVGMVELPEEWRKVLGYRYIEISFPTDGSDPAVRVVGGQDFDDPDKCTVATGVYRNGQMVWNPRRKAS